MVRFQVPDFFIQTGDLGFSIINSVVGGIGQSVSVRC